MIKKTLLILSLPLLLAACQTTQAPTKTNLQLLTVPTSLVDCDRIKVVIPATNGLKNRDVGQYIIKLRQALNECQVDAASAKEYMAKVQKELNGKK